MTKAIVRIRAPARRDLTAYANWLRAEVDIETSQRFAAQADATFLKLAANPKLAPAIPSQNIRLSDVRKWRVESFPKMLIFYAPISGGVRIIRVLHTAQDWWAALDIVSDGE